MDKNYLVNKANSLIMARYNLSLEEQRVILVLASLVQPNDEEFKPYKFSIKEFIEILGVNDKNKYIEIPKITRELMKKSFEIREGNKILQLSWLSSAEYEIGSGKVELCFDPKLKPYLLKLNKLFTSYKLENVLNLKSKYSIRLYEILKSNQYKKQGYEIDVDEFKAVLGIGKNEYPNFYNLKQRVIIQAQKEINKKTDLHFDFEEIKSGRKVTSIKFFISSNPQSIINKNLESEVCTTLEDYVEDATNNYINEVLSIFNEKITINEAKQILKAANNDIEKIREKYIIAKQMNNINNLVGWIIRAIQDDYQMPQNHKKEFADLVPKNYFNGYSQRHYDIDELEKKLLEASKIDSSKKLK